MSLEVRGLTKDYPTRSGPLSVLRGIDMDVAAGEALVIMGPSGSGKSTLLYILGTLDEPTSGTVRIGKYPADNSRLRVESYQQGSTTAAPVRTEKMIDPFALSGGELAAFRNGSIGFVFQDHHLLPQCSVLENVLIPSLVGPDDGAISRARAVALLERVGLGHRLDHRPAELSGGERQRVAVARALLHRPSLVLADEPTGNLDRTSARAVGALLLEMCQEEGGMLVTVTHSADLARRFPRVLVMDDGQLRQPAEEAAP
jgi:lipoprotein-releasing system ATP-binding protein